MRPCQVWFVCCFSLSCPFTVSASVSLFLPACFQSAPPFQHIKEPWLVQCTGTPLVSFALGPNKECPLSFSVAPFEVLPSTCKWGTAGGALKMVTQPPVLLCRLRLTEIKRVGGLMTFVRRRCHVNVGVRVHGCTYVIVELLGEGREQGRGRLCFISALPGIFSPCFAPSCACCHVFGLGEHSNVHELSLKWPFLRIYLVLSTCKHANLFFNV